MGTWNESHIEWTGSRSCTVCVNEDCKLGMYNTWCDILHIKNRLH